MKPMHATLTRISRCPCCKSRYHKGNCGKKAARAKAKLEIKKELDK